MLETLGSVKRTTCLVLNVAADDSISLLGITATGSRGINRILIQTELGQSLVAGKPGETPRIQQ